MANAPLKSYEVLHPVTHDGQRYAPGETIELADADAKPLLRAGIGLGSADQLKKRTGAIRPVVVAPAPKAAAGPAKK